MRGAEADLFEIGHIDRRERFGQHMISIQLKIGPERRAEKDNIAKFGGIILQDVHVGSKALLLEHFSQVGQRFAIELVITEHMDNRRSRERTLDPTKSAFTDGYIPSQ